MAPDEAKPKQPTQRPAPEPEPEEPAEPTGLDEHGVPVDDRDAGDDIPASSETSGEFPADDVGGEARDVGDIPASSETSGDFPADDVAGDE